MTTEFAIYSDEGCIEAGFYSAAEAEARIKEAYSEEDGLYVAQCCHEHPEQPHDACQECPADDAEDETDEESENEE